MKRRISITLDRTTVQELDATVDGITVRSRSDAIEKILKKHAASQKTAVILAGGDPRRLFIPDLRVYRPLVRIGKSTVIEHLVSQCREAGFSTIVIIGSAPLITLLYETLRNGERYGADITYIEEQRPLGSAKTLELAKKYLPTDFLFLPCDFYCDVDLGKLFAFHRSHGGTVTLAIHAGTGYEWKKGIVEMDGYKIVRYEENPKMPATTLVGLFLGFMTPEVFNYIPPGNVRWSLQEQVFPRLAKEGKLVGYPVAGKWINVHTAADAGKARHLDRERS